MPNDVDQSPTIVARHDRTIRVLFPLAAIAFLGIAVGATIENPAEWRLSLGLAFGSFVFAAFAVWGSESISLTRSGIEQRRWFYSPRFVAWADIDELVESANEVRIRCSWRGVSIPISRLLPEFRQVMDEVAANLPSDQLVPSTQCAALPVTYTESWDSLASYWILRVIVAITASVLLTAGHVYWGVGFLLFSIFLGVSLPRGIEVHNDRVVFRFLAWNRTIQFDQLVSVKMGSTEIAGGLPGIGFEVADNKIIFTLANGRTYEFHPRSGITTVLAVINASFNAWRIRAGVTPPSKSLTSFPTAR